MCLPDSNCNPVELSSTEGEDATLDASITFVNGGTQNQNIKAMILYKDTVPIQYLYSCPQPSNGCTDTDKIQVTVSSGHNSMQMLVILKQVTLEDASQYKVEIIAASAYGFSITRKSIFFSLNVIGN